MFKAAERAAGMSFAEALQIPLTRLNRQLTAPITRMHSHSISELCSFSLLDIVLIHGEWLGLSLALFMPHQIVYVPNVVTIVGL